MRAEPVTSTERDDWVEPRDLADVDQRIAAYRAAVQRINSQLMLRRAQAAAGEYPGGEAAYLEWRRLAIKALSYKQQMLAKLKAWRRERARTADGRTIYQLHREARYLLHRVVEDAMLPPDLLAKITAYLGREDEEVNP